MCSNYSVQVKSTNLIIAAPIGIDVTGLKQTIRFQHECESHPGRALVAGRVICNALGAGASDLSKRHSTSTHEILSAASSSGMLVR